MTIGPEAEPFDLGSKPPHAQEDGKKKRPDPFFPQAASSPKYWDNQRIGGMTGNDDFCEHAAGSDFEDALLAGIVHNASQSAQ